MKNQKFWRNNSIIKLSLLVLFFLITFVHAQKEYPSFDLQSECSSTQYFDYSSLTCRACETNNAVPDENGICKCKLGYYINHVVSSFYTCSECETVNYSLFFYIITNFYFLFFT